MYCDVKIRQTFGGHLFDEYGARQAILTGVCMMLLQLALFTVMADACLYYLYDRNGHDFRKCHDLCFK